MVTTMSAGLRQSDFFHRGCCAAVTAIIAFISSRVIAARFGLDDDDGGGSARVTILRDASAGAGRSGSR